MLANIFKTTSASKKVTPPRRGRKEGGGGGEGAAVEAPGVRGGVKKAGGAKKCMQSIGEKLGSIFGGKRVRKDRKKVRSLALKSSRRSF